MKRFSRSKKKERIMVRDKRHKKSAPKRPTPWTHLGLITGMWLLTSLIFYGIGLRSTALTDLGVGQRAPESVVASVDFTCEDLAKTDLARSQAAKETPPAFKISDKPWAETERFLSHLEVRLKQLQMAEESRIETARTAIASLLELMGLKLTPADFAGLSDDVKIEGSITMLNQVFKEILTAPLVEEEDKSTQFQGLIQTGQIVIYSKDDVRQKEIELEEISGVQLAREKAVSLSRKQIPKSVLSDHVLEVLAARWITPNLIYDRAQTARLQKEAIAAVDPISETVITGTTIIEAHDTITPQALVRLRSHEQRISETESRYQRVMRILGGSALLLAALLGTTGIFSVVKGHWKNKNRELLLLVLLCLITLAIDKALLFSATRIDLIDPSSVNFLLPHALTPLLVTVLLGPVCGVISGLWTSLASAILFDQNFGIFMLGFLVTIVSTHLGSEVKNRASLLRAAIWIILTKVVFVLVLAVLNKPALHVIWGQLGATAISGLFSAFFAILTIPLFEVMFKITTDIKLLELSDMGHPLLQRMAIEAPGTYHHSLMMANLAAQAAERIGANALLTRVSAYFHDIGKMVKPEFFTENCQYRENPHDELAPSMSTLVIMSHVKEGEELARRYRLPEQVIAGIREHHGTSLVSYFYHRAKTQSEESDTTVEESDYRYPGPRPVTKEMAILALADSVEAASRSLEKATPNRITALVDEIVDKKVKDRQLADSELTLAQLTEIKKSFVFTLTNMLHGRVAYPKDEDNHSKPTD